MNIQKLEMVASQKKGQTRIVVRGMGGEELKQVEEFKYLGSEGGKEGVTGAVKERIKATWMKWREVICDRRIPWRLKCKVYKTMVGLVPM